MLKVQFKDSRQDPFWVLEKSFSLGRSSNNAVVIQDPSVSSSHAKIVVRDDHFLLRDLGSEKGTLINGQHIDEQQIHFGDTLALGSVELEVVDPYVEHEGANYWSLIADSSWIAGKEFPVGDHLGCSAIIGRSPECDIVLAGTHLSRFHAKITVNETSLTIDDLHSANGTSINGKKVMCEEALPGDRVSFDTFSFRVFSAKQALDKPSSKFAGDIESTTILEAPKHWQLKPTSPGNRVEHDLYKKQHIPALLALLVISGLAAAVTYVIWGIMSGG